MCPDTRQGEQTLRPILVHLPTGVLFLGVIHEVMHVALHGPIAAGRVGREPTARLHGEVRGLLHRFDYEIAGRVDDHGSLTTDPGNGRRSVFVVMPSTGL